MLLRFSRPTCLLAAVVMFGALGGCRDAAEPDVNAADEHDNTAPAMVALHEAGTVTAVHTVAVNGPMVWGDSRIARIIAEGVYVELGDTLIVVANERLDSRLESVGSELAVQRLVLASLDAKLTAHSIAAANAITKSRLSHELSALAEENQRFGSEQARLAARLRRRQSDIDLALAIGDSVAQAHLDSLELARTRLRADRLEARLERIRLYVAQLIVLSPATGMVVYHRERTEEGIKVARVGDQVEYNQHLLDITDLSALEAEVLVHERDRWRLVVGQPVLVEPDAFPERLYTGRLARVLSLPVSAETGRVSRQFTAYARLDSVDAFLRPGMSVRVTIDLEAQREQP